MADPVYATQADLARFGVMASATQAIPSASLDAALSSASRVLDSYFRARYSLPLLDWDDSVREKTCWIAAYNVLSMRGFSQDAGRDEQVRMRYESAVAWAEGVERQRVHPRVTQTAVAAPSYQFPQISTSPKRGW